MTKAGNQWVDNLSAKEDSRGYEPAHALSRRAAEFWLRAFVAEVEQRSKNQSAYDYDAEMEEAVFWAYDELKRELLGD